MMTLNETMVLILMIQKTATKITPKLIDNKKKKKRNKKGLPVSETKHLCKFM